MPKPKIEIIKCLKKNQCLDEQILCKQTTMYLSYFWSSYWLSKTKVVDAIGRARLLRTVFEQCEL